MHRFYLPSLSFKKNEMTLVDPRIVQQISKVLRMKTGDEIRFFDGKREVHVSIQSLKKKKITVQWVSEIQNKNEPKLKVTLYQAVPKKIALFELVIQKATEIGVHQIVPLLTERTENHRPLRFERLQSIAMEAAEQSERLHVPTIHPHIQFSDALSSINIGLMAYARDDKKSLSEVMKSLPKTDDLSLLIGPEGGFSSAEIEAAKKAGIEPFGLGPRILRTETAAMVGLGALLLN